MEVNERKTVGALARMAVLSLALAQSAPPLAIAEYVPPSEVAIRTKAYQPQDTNFPIGSYDYQISWQGIPVGIASIRTATTSRAGRKMFDVVATACSGRVLSWFYKLRHRSESVFSADDLKPQQFRSHQTENLNFADVAIDFAPDGWIRANVRKGRLNTEGRSEDVAFKSENATFDPVSAAFLVRSLPPDPAEDRSFDVFNGRDRYLISFHVVGRERIKVGGQERDTFKVRPSVKKLTDTEAERRIRKVYLWIAADASRAVVKLESEVLLGSISATLTGFVPGNAADTDPANAATSRYCAVSAN